MGPFPFAPPSVVKIAMIMEENEFQHILRVYNTNVEGRHKIMFALTKIRGVGRRFANLACNKADIDMNKRAGELTREEIDKFVDVIQHPLSYKIPIYFLNRKRDIKTGTNTQVVSNAIPSSLRIWRGSARSVVTVVSVTCGLFVFV